MSLIEITETLAEAVRHLDFQPPVAFAYRPLDYARDVHRRYLERWGGGGKQALLVGMNPGPWGMAQTGVPFGAVPAVRDWLRLGDATVETPDHPTHPKRPVLGWDCPREEVSGRRIWGFAEAVFGTPERFFARFFVGNYIPLLFLDERARNLTPDKLAAADRKRLQVPCDRALHDLALALGVPLVIGVGAFAARQAQRALARTSIQVAQILHPSPASPAANRGWAKAASAQLQALGIDLG